MSTILPFIDFLGFKIPMYGVMSTIGTILGVIIVIFRKNRYGISREDLILSAAHAGIGILIGAKAVYFITNIGGIIKNFEVLSKDFKTLINYAFGGYVFYGGLIGGLIAGILYAKYYKINAFKLIDSFAPSIPLIHAFGRIGCFFAGCCYGRPSEKFGVFFNSPQIAPTDIKLFPIQLVESGINFIVFLFLFIYSYRKPPLGRLAGLYLSIYAIERFILEFFRYDYIRGSLLGITTSQWISILILPVGMYLILSANKKETEN